MNAIVNEAGASVFHMGAYNHEMIKSIFNQVDVSWPKDARAKFVVSSMGELSLIRSTHSTRNSISRRLDRHIVEENKEYYYACLPLEGRLNIRHLGRDCTLERGALTLLTSNEEYEIEMSDILDAIWLRIPTRLLQSHAISVDEVLGRELDVRHGLGFVAKQMMYGVLNDRRQLSPRGAKVLSQSLLSFLGEVIDSSLYDDIPISSSGRRKILSRAREFIEEHIYDDEINPQLIAQGIGISSRYLSEIFAADGTSPMRWVRKRRLEMCRMELEKQSGGQKLICEVAYSMGFTNISSFNRAFKAHFGHSPRDLLAQKSNSAKKLN